MKLVFCGTPHFAVPTLEALIAAGTKSRWLFRSPTGRWAARNRLAAAAGEAGSAGRWTRGHAAREDSQQRGVSRAAGSDCAGRDCRGGVRAHHSSVDAGSCRAWGASICMRRCCRSIAERRRFSGRWRWARRSPATRRCCLKRGWIPGRSCCSKRVADQTGTDGGGSCLTCWREDGAPLVVETLAGLEDGYHSSRRCRITRWRRSLRFSSGKMGAWTLRRARRRSLWNRWRGFQPWPGAFTTLDGKKLIVHRTASGAKSRLRGIRRIALIITDQHLQVACAQNTWLEFVEIAARRQEAHGCGGVSARSRTACRDSAGLRPCLRSLQRERRLSQFCSRLSEVIAHSDDLLRGKSVECALDGGSQPCDRVWCWAVLRWQIDLDDQFEDACSSTPMRSWMPRC